MSAFRNMVENIFIQSDEQNPTVRTNVVPFPHIPMLGRHSERQQAVDRGMGKTPTNLAQQPLTQKLTLPMNIAQSPPKISFIFAGTPSLQALHFHYRHYSTIALPVPLRLQYQLRTHDSIPAQVMKAYMSNSPHTVLQNMPTVPQYGTT